MTEASATAQARESFQTPVDNSSPFDGFSGTVPKASDTNVHALRYAYMPGVWNAASNARSTGYPVFRQGLLIGFRTFNIGGLFDTSAGTDGRAPVNNKIAEVNAATALRNALKEYQVEDRIDHGFRAFEQLTGEPLAADYFNIVHPSFENLNHVCPRKLVVCPTCRKDNLPVSDGDLLDFARIYLQNNARDKDGLEINRLSLDVLKSVRDVIRDSCTGFTDFAGEMWREISDLKEQSKNAPVSFVIDPSHFHYRNVIHGFDQNEFEEQKEVRLAAAIANITQGMNIQNAVNGSGGNGGSGLDLQEFRDLALVQSEAIKKLTGELQALKMRLGRKGKPDQTESEIMNQAED